MKNNIRQILIAVRDGDIVPSAKQGICAVIHDQLKKHYYPSFERNEAQHELECLFVRLGLNTTYPVFHPNKRGYRAFMDAYDLWDRDTAYGRNRWALVDQLIEALS